MKRISTIMIASLFVMGTTAVAQSDPVPGKNGNKYVPYEERTGNESIVYFTRNLSAEGLIEAYEQVSANIKGTYRCEAAYRGAERTEHYPAGMG